MWKPCALGVALPAAPAAPAAAGVVFQATASTASYPFRLPSRDP